MGHVPALHVGQASTGATGSGSLADHLERIGAPALPGILDAALLEATLSGPPAPVPARRVRRFAEALESLRWQPDVSDIGQAWTARSRRVSLRALAAGTALAHVSAVSA